jgi:hypothetical protein
MNVYILIGINGYNCEENEGVFPTLEKAVNKASRHIRIEEFSLDTGDFIGMYTTEGKRAAIYNDELMEI